MGPTVASVPHSVVNGFKNIAAVCLEADIDIPQIATIKEFLADPSKFAAAAPAAESAAAAPVEEKKEAAKEESESGSDDDMDLDCLTRLSRYIWWWWWTKENMRRRTRVYVDQF